MKDVWKSVTTSSGVLSVATPGIPMQLKLFVANWDIMPIIFKDHTPMLATPQASQYGSKMLIAKEVSQVFLIVQRL